MPSDTRATSTVTGVRFVSLRGCARVAARRATLAPGRVFRRCLFLALFFVPNKDGSAQLPQVSAPPEWSNSSKFSFIQTRGNTESTTFGFANELITAWAKTEIKLEMSALRTRTTGFERSAMGTADDFQVEEQTETRVSAENYHMSFRGDRGFSERSTIFSQVGWTRNTFSGIDARYVLVGGVSTRWVEDELHQLRSSYGPTFTVQNDVVPNPDVATTFIGLHVSAEYEVQLTDNTELRSKLVVEENAFHLTDLRADWVSTLGVSMSDHFGLQAKFQYHFDNHPSLVDVALTGERGEPAGRVPVPLGKSDRVLTMALVVSF